MMREIVAAEQIKILRSPAFYIAAAFSLLTSLSYILLMRYALLNPEVTGYNPAAVEQAAAAIFWPSALAMSIQKIVQSAPLLIFVFIGATLAKEYTWGTLKVPLSLGIKRAVVLSSKTLALLLPVFIVAVAVPLLVESACSIFFSQSLSELRPELPFLFQGTSMLSLISLLPYFSLACMLSVVGRSPVVAIGGGVSFVLAEGIAVSLFEGIKCLHYTPKYLADLLIANNGRLPHVLLLLLWSTVFFGIALYTFKRQQLTE